MASRHESLKQKEAFEYFYVLGEKRTLKKVADHFGVTQRTVQNWSAWFHWRARVQQLDIKIGDEMENKMIDSISDMKAEIVDSLFGIVKDGLIDQIKDGNIPVEIKNVKDIDTLVKLIMLLVGEADSRTDTNVVQKEIQGMSDEDKARFKEALGAFAKGGGASDGGVEYYDELSEEGESTDAG